MRNRSLLILLVGAALSTATVSSCSSDKGNGYDHYKRTHAVQTEEEYNDSMAYVQQNQQQYQLQQQPQAEPYEYQTAPQPQVIVVPSYANGYGYNSAGYNNQGYDRYGHYSDRWDYDHHRDPYHPPTRTSSVGSHVAAGAVGAAAGAAAGYYYAKNKATTPSRTLSTVQPRTRPLASNITARPLSVPRTAAPAYKPSAPPANLRNTAFGNSLTKKYSGSPAPSRPSSSSSFFKRSSNSSGGGGSIFGKRSKRR